LAGFEGAKLGFEHIADTPITSYPRATHEAVGGVEFGGQDKTHKSVPSGVLNRNMNW